MSVAPPTVRSHDAPDTGHAVAAVEGEDIPQMAEDGEELYDKVDH